MTAKQTVFLNEDRTEAVPEGDPRARFKLVHAGQEISQEEAEKYGAVELIGGAKKAPPAGNPPAPENREDDTAKKLHKRGK